MNSNTCTAVVSPPVRQLFKGLDELLQGAENAVLSFTLAAMAILPLAEIVLRATLHTGISGAAVFTQHLALIAGMLGAAVAARDQRLLALSTFGSLLRGNFAALARGVSGTVATTIGALLCLAGIEFVLAEHGAGNTIAYGIPIWIGQAILPVGFLLIALRLAGGVSDNWVGRGVVLSIALAVAWAAASRLPISGNLVVVALLTLLIATVLGAPVFVTLGGAALILFWGDGLPIASIPLDHYRLVVNPSLPMIPLFTLAGYFLAEGGAPRRLIRVFNALFGGFRGGAAIVTVAVCTFFTSFSGASGVTILALGGMLMPLLLAARYSERGALGLLTSSGSLGGLLPPGLPLVLYAIVAKISIEDMFIAALIPALLLITLITLWGISLAPRTAPKKQSLDWNEARTALLAAKWELALPLIAFAGLFGGFATPVEAAALTAVYAFVVEVIVYRDLSLRRDVLRVMTECGLLVGGVLLILGVALGFTNYLVDAQVPEHAVEWVKNAIQSRWVFLLTLNLFLLIAGCLMDIFSATILLVPLIVPMGVAFGVDPMHLGIIFLTNMELGYLTPPVGMNLFFTSYRFGKPLSEVCRAALPGVAVLGLGVLLVTYLPWLATGLLMLLK